MSLFFTVHHNGCRNFEDTNPPTIFPAARTRASSGEALLKKSAFAVQWGTSKTTIQKVAARDRTSPTTTLIVCATYVFVFRGNVSPSVARHIFPASGAWRAHPSIIPVPHTRISLCKKTFLAGKRKSNRHVRVPARGRKRDRLSVSDSSPNDDILICPLQKPDANNVERCWGKKRISHWAKWWDSVTTWQCDVTPLQYYNITT